MSSSAPYLSTTHSMGACTQARYVTIGYRMFYTGAASSAQGLMIVDNLGFKQDSEGPDNAEILGYINGAAGAATIAAGTSAWASVESTAFDSNGYTTRQQLVTRPEHGVQGVLPMLESSRAHTFKPWWEYGHMLVADTTSPIANWTVLGGNQIANQNPSATAVFVDSAFGETNITVTLPGSYRLEVISCLEQDLEPTSALIDLSHKSKAWNEPVLATDDMLNSVVGPTPLDEPIIKAPLAQRPQRVRRPKAASGPKPKVSTARQTRRRNKRRRQRAKARAQRNTNAGSISLAVQGLRIE
jgi:hypothetical protein